MLPLPAFKTCVWGGIKMLMLLWHAYPEISPQPYTGVLMSACPAPLPPTPVTSGWGRVCLDLYVDGTVFLPALLA